MGKKLEEKELRYQDIAKHIPVKIWITNDDGHCIYLNDKWFYYTGQSAKVALGFGWLDAVHPEERKYIREEFTKANQAQAPFEFEYRLKDKDDNYRWHLDIGEPLFDEDEEFEGFVGTVIDIHERKLAEEALRKRESWYKRYAEAMPQMAFVADKEGNIIFFNQRWYDFVGGMKDTEGWGWKEKRIHHPDDLQPTIDRWKHSLETGEPYEVEYRLLRHDNQYRWHLGRANPIRDEQGNIQLWLGTNTDIHEQKQSEEKLRDANAHLKEQNKKLEKMRQLQENILHIVGHDLRGPIANMQMIMDLMKSPQGVNKSKLINGLDEMIHRQQKTVEGIVELIQVQSPEELKFVEITLEALLNELLREYKQPLLSCNGHVSYEFTKAPVIHFVQTFLYSILKNLISNAIKYRSSKRTLDIEVTSEKLDGFVKVSVKDNGTGINMEKYKYKLFQPFERFTEKVEGTGIGLYIVKNLIEENGGYIEVDSAPDQGSTFHCYFKEYL